MARLPDRAPAEEEDALVAEGAHFEGTLVLPRAGRIDGNVRGEVLARGSLRIGPAGVVEADLEASRVLVEGRVVGDLRARGSIALGPRAVVQGDLAAPSLAVAEGARIDGRCRCGEAAEWPRGEAKPSEAPGSGGGGAS